MFNNSPSLPLLRNVGQCNDCDPGWQLNLSYAVLEETFMLCGSCVAAGCSDAGPCPSLQRWEGMLQWVEKKSWRNLGLLGTLIVSRPSRHTQKEV